MNPSTDASAVSVPPSLRTHLLAAAGRTALVEAALDGGGLTAAEARSVIAIGAGAETAVDLAAGLALDDGYVSRVLGGLEKRGLVSRAPAPQDRRRRVLALTGKGVVAATAAAERVDRAAAALVGPLSPEARESLGAVAARLETLLAGGGVAGAGDFALREPGPGDVGTVISRHGVLYGREYGWDATFEGLVAGMLGEFLRGHDGERERGWIAERAGMFAGSLFITRADERVARLRCLLVEPESRGAGLGTLLVQSGIAFAAAAGYETLTLWTMDTLVDARRLYEREGFHLVREVPQESFGCTHVGQTWERELAS